MPCRFLAAMTVLAVSLLLLLPGAGCAPTVTFPVIHAGMTGVGREIGMEFGKVDFEVNLDLVDLKETAAARKKNAAAQGSATDAELFGPLVERKVRERIASSPAVRVLSRPTHTLDLSGVFYARDMATVKKEEIRLENRVIDIKETHVVDRIYELTLRFELRSASTGSVLGSGKQERVRTVSGTGRSVDEAVRRFETWEANLDLLVGQAVSRMAAEILPSQETVKRRLREGDAKPVRESVDVAVREGLDAGWPLWRDLLSRKEALSSADRAAVQYDAAIYHEYKDEVAEARAAFEQCIAERPDPWCSEGLERLELRERELTRMR